MITVSWGHTKLHASVSTGNYTACGIPVPPSSEQDILYAFDGVVTCKNCLASIASQQHAQRELEVMRRKP